MLSFDVPAPKSALTRERTIEKKNAVQNPEISNPGTIAAARIIRSAFTTSENNPKVKMFTGNVRALMIGLMNALIRPSTTASTSAPTGVTVAPGIRYAAIPIAIADTIQCNIFIVVFLKSCNFTLPFARYPIFY